MTRDRGAGPEPGFRRAYSGPLSCGLSRHIATTGRMHTGAMARRADPERIHEARRIAVCNTLTGSGMSLEAAEQWCDAWILEATGRGLPRHAAYWQLGEEWIAAERAARRPGW
jgi:hypothetical protein